MKEWYQSKIVWLNILTTIVLMAEFVGQVQPELLSATITISGLLNIVLRVWFTNTEIRSPL
jgi:hypothetical protein